MRGEVGSASLLNVRLKGNNNKIKKKGKKRRVLFCALWRWEDSWNYPQPADLRPQGLEKKREKISKVWGRKGRAEPGQYFYLFYFFFLPSLGH